MHGGEDDECRRRWYDEFLLLLNSIRSNDGFGRPE